MVTSNYILNMMVVIFSSGSLEYLVFIFFLTRLLKYNFRNVCIVYLPILYLIRFNTFKV